MSQNRPRPAPIAFSARCRSCERPSRATRKQARCPLPVDRVRSGNSRDSCRRGDARVTRQRTSEALGRARSRLRIAGRCREPTTASTFPGTIDRRGRGHLCARRVGAIEVHASRRKRWFPPPWAPLRAAFAGTVSRRRCTTVTPPTFDSEMRVDGPAGVQWHDRGLPKLRRCDRSRAGLTPVRLEFGIGAETRSLLERRNRLARSLCPISKAPEAAALQMLRVFRKNVAGDALGPAQVSAVAGRHRPCEGFSLGSHRGANAPNPACFFIGKSSHHHISCI